jgi:hypothetical protein
MSWDDQIGEYRAGEYDALDIPPGTVMTRRPPLGTAGRFIFGFYWRALLAIVMLVALLTVLAILLVLVAAVTSGGDKGVINTVTTAMFVLIPLLLPYACYLAMTLMAGKDFGGARLVFVKLPAGAEAAAATEKPVELQDYPAGK